MFYGEKIKETEEQGHFFCRFFRKDGKITQALKKLEDVMEFMIEITII
jgi:hypothetical protein